MALSDWKIVAPLAYRSKEGCEDVRCTNSPNYPFCMGWHCSYCDEPCSSQGHGCDAAKTLIDAAGREAD